MDTASSEPNERDAPIGFAKDLWTRVREHDISGLAAELAYRFLFALFPFLLFVASLGSFVARAVGLDNPTDNIIAGLGDNLPAALAATIRPEVQRVVEEQHPDLASLGALLALWAATSGTMTIVKAMNRAYGVRETRSLPARYALGLVLTIAGSIAVVTSFVTIVGGTVLTGQVVQSLGMTQAWGVISLARWPIIFIFLVAGTTILFRVGPDMRPPWRAAVLGAVVFTVGWLVATLGVALYVGNIANYGATYGALAGVIVLMLWLYLTGFVLLLGAEVVAIVTLRIAPERLADHVRDNDPTFAIERGGRAARRAIGGVREALDDRGGEPGRPAR